MPYEKVGKNEPVCIADEVPFDIPDSWEWVRLGNITEILRGKGPKYAENTRFKILNQKCVRWGDVDTSFCKTVDKNWFESIPMESLTTLQDVLINSTGEGTIGRSSVVTSDAINLPYDSHVLLIRPYKCINTYIEIFINGVEGQAQINRSKGAKTTKQTELGVDKTKNLLIPLPPLNEQRRIVEKLEKLEPYINDYDKAYEKIEKLNTDFPDLLKKSILQEAVQGKLVSQDPTDEPASVLIEQIQKEKEQLIKDKKIKKDKNESYIFRRDNSHYEKVGKEERCIDDELPFDIPDSWEWTRLKSICIVNPRNQAEDDIDAGFIPMTLINDGYTGGHMYETKKWKQIKSGFTHFVTGDLVLAKITPCFQNRKSTIISELPNNIGAGTTELHVIRNYPNSKLNLKYLLLLVKTADFISAGVKAFTGTAGQQRVGKTFVEEYLVPLPPLNEQQRIADRVNQLLPQISKL